MSSHKAEVSGLCGVVRSASLMGRFQRVLGVSSSAYRVLLFTYVRKTFTEYFERTLGCLDNAGGVLIQLPAFPPQGVTPVFVDVQEQMAYPSSTHTVTHSYPYWKTASISAPFPILGELISTPISYYRALTPTCFVHPHCPHSAPHVTCVVWFAPRYGKASRQQVHAVARPVPEPGEP